MVPGTFPPAPGVPVFSGCQTHNTFLGGKVGRWRFARKPRAGFEPATCALQVRCSTVELPRHFLCTFHSWVSKIPGAVFWRFVEIAQLLTVLARFPGAAGFSPLLLRLGAAFAFPLGDVACRATFLLVHGAEDFPFDPVLYSPVHPDQ